MEAQSAAAPTGAEHRRLNPRSGAGFWAAVVGTAVVAAAVAAVGAGAWWIAALGPPRSARDLAFSTTVVDRDGRLLRPYATDTGRWRLPARSDSVDPRYLELLIAYEDKRFRAHAGADPLALLRAGGQFLAHGRILSGGSTLTMQVARLLEPRGERSFAAKLRQIVRAFEIERHLSKDEVLALYLSLAPYGGNLEGIRAAALAYFGKEPKRLTLGEAALLVACRRRRKRAARIASRRRPAVRATAYSTGWRPPASSTPKRFFAPRPSRSRRSAGRCRCSRRMPPTMPWRHAGPFTDPAYHRWAVAGEPRGACARAGENAGAGYFGRDPGRGACHRRRAGAGRFRRLF